MGTDLIRFGPNFDLHMQSGPKNEMVPAKDANWKLNKGRKICNEETIRVKRHEQIRNRQLEMQEETRVKQVLNEKKDAQR